MSKHTPGPWINAGNGDIIAIHPTQCGGVKDVCTVYMTESDEDDANARLIAAAPDLLAALEMILPILLDWHSDFPDSVGSKEEPAVRAARAAIAKAKGDA